VVIKDDYYRLDCTCRAFHVDCITLARLLLLFLLALYVSRFRVQLLLLLIFLFL
jgi:hypothetical protein